MSSSGAGAVASTQGHGLVYESDRWQVHLGRRELLAGGVPVPIGARAFEIVEVLVQSTNELVTKDDLMGRIWPGAMIGENTLQVHISAIRKAFGRDRKMLKTAAGRGYRLTGQWTAKLPAAHSEHVDPALVRVAVEPDEGNLPLATTDLIGRDAAVRHLRDLMSAYRVVTLTGPGGIGKTKLALKVARDLMQGFDGGVRLVELASLSDADLVPSSVASALGLNLGGAAITPEAVARSIGDLKLLLVLDNCEHVIDAAARLVEAVVGRCPRTSVLVTSQELLRISAEYVYRVPPLEVPRQQREEQDDALEHSAVQLFVARTQALDSAFSAGEENVRSLVVAICQRLDGIPLAIEFAAASAASLGVQHVALHLEDRFRLLTSGRRTALPKQRTLRAALDWSHGLLTASERVVFRRLAVFAGSFSLDAASALAASPEDTPSQVVDCFSGLIAKSLVVAKTDDTGTHYRLLDTTRSYAREKLDQSSEAEQMLRRHAEYYRGLFEKALAEWDSRPTAEMRSEYGRQIDDVRAAIERAFSPGGNALTGAALTAAAAPLWMHLSLLQECRGRVEQAIAALAAAEYQDIRLEMKLHTALGASLAWVGGSVSDIEAAWVRALHLAESLGDVDHQLRSLWGLWLLKEREALPLARQFLALALTPADKLLGERMIAVSSHYLGDQNTARHHIERVVANDSADDTGRRIVGFQIDQRLGARAFLARILWVQGFPDQAIQVVKSLVEQARTAGHANSLCHSLAIAGCPIALWTGDLDLAEHYTDLLRDSSARHGLSLWRAFGKAFQGVVLIKRGDPQSGIPLLRGGVDDFGAAFAGYRNGSLYGELAAALGRAGQVSEGLATIQEAVDRTERNGEGWIMPELLRVKGELLALHGTGEAADEAESCFRWALNRANEQNASAWELRAATSLARLPRDHDRSADAIARLRQTYDRFTEGFETADLRLARTLLATLS